MCKRVRVVDQVVIKDEQQSRITVTKVDIRCLSIQL